MLAAQARLELFDLFLDFLFAIAGGKENVVWIGKPLLPFTVAIVPKGGIVFFIARGLIALLIKALWLSVGVLGLLQNR